MTEDHGYCPSCYTDLNGELIFQHFFNEFTEGAGYWLDEEGVYTDTRRLLSPAEAREKALEVSSYYGATETQGRFGKQIGLYSMEKDRTVAWKCPECGHEWERK